MRMAQDIAKRENEKRVNEMRKTVEVAFLPCCRVLRADARPHW